MSLSIQPFESLLASAITGLIITGGQKGVAASIVKRANTALAIGNALSSLEQGNSAPAIGALQGVINNSDLDPGVAVAVKGAFTLISQQSALLASINGAIPGLGTVEATVAANISAGIVAAANAEIAKYGTAPAA